MSNPTAPKREITRAERVRARWMTEKKNQKKKPAATQRQSQAHPAVKVKPNSAENPFARPVNQTHRKNRSVEGKELTKPSVNRRITIPLNQQGAEIEFSTMPVLNMGWRFISAVIAAAAIVAIIFLSFTTRVEAAQVVGLPPTLASEVESLMGVTGKPIFLLEPVQIKERIEKSFPEIESIDINIDFPAAVTVTAEKRKAVYAWVMDELIYLIDGKGTLYPAEPGTGAEGLIPIKADSLPEMKLEFEKSDDIIVEIIEYANPSGYATPTPLPTFRGDSYTVKPSVLNALEQILLYLPSGAELIYDQRHGFGWYDEQGWDAYFGFDLEQIDMKIAVYDSIVKNINYQGIDVSIISVEYVHAPYYRED